MPDDVDLFRRARAGDPASLGLLLRRYEPAMRAQAYRLVGYGPDADDAVQDAALIAVTRIGDVRDPDAVGAWLRTVVRNVCLAQLRRPRPVSTDDLDRTLTAVAADPAQLFDGRATRDWVWHAVEQLSPALRIVVLLRYFTPFRSYQTISQICGVPVGTVRSRLSEARTKLTGHLRATVEHAHPDAGHLARRRRHEAEDLLVAVAAGRVHAALSDRWSSMADVAWPDGARTSGLGAVVDGITGNYDDGVRYRLADVVASSDIVIWEVENLNPADKPWHCPRSVAWTHFLDSGRVSRFRLYFATPASA
ncbi:RNA polymerase sigma factor [Actinoplanes sp. NPDC049265]|uniref:RNA polymerase sigma factor n=1 Tax=Actinoplanes sp. NPDC049265 TaxID=3363902 RepID=UPI003711022C